MAVAPRGSATRYALRPMPLNDFRRQALVVLNARSGTGCGPELAGQLRGVVRDLGMVS